LRIGFNDHDDNNHDDEPPLMNRGFLQGDAGENRFGDVSAVAVEPAAVTPPSIGAPHRSHWADAHTPVFHAAPATVSAAQQLATEENNDDMDAEEDVAWARRSPGDSAAELTANPLNVTFDQPRQFFFPPSPSDPPPLGSAAFEYPPASTHNTTSDFHNSVGLASGPVIAAYPHTHAADLTAEEPAAGVIDNTNDANDDNTNDSEPGPDFAGLTRAATVLVDTVPVRSATLRLAATLRQQLRDDEVEAQRQREQHAAWERQQAEEAQLRLELEAKEREEAAAAAAATLAVKGHRRHGIEGATSPRVLRKTASTMSGQLTGPTSASTAGDANAAANLAGADVVSSVAPLITINKTSEPTTATATAAATPTASAKNNKGKSQAHASPAPKLAIHTVVESEDEEISVALRPDAKHTNAARREGSTHGHHGGGGGGSSSRSGSPVEMTRPGSALQRKRTQTVFTKPSSPVPVLTPLVIIAPEPVRVIPPPSVLPPPPPPYLPARIVTEQPQQQQQKQPKVERPVSAATGAMLNNVASVESQAVFLPPPEPPAPPHVRKEDPAVAHLLAKLVHKQAVLDAVDAKTIHQQHHDRQPFTQVYCLCFIVVLSCHLTDQRVVQSLLLHVFAGGSVDNFRDPETPASINVDLVASQAASAVAKSLPAARPIAVVHPTVVPVPWTSESVASLGSERKPTGFVVGDLADTLVTAKKQVCSCVYV
jgi:hypothetical protein